jgi:oligopeptide transport system permease protein
MKYSLKDRLSKPLEDSISEKIKEETAILQAGGMGDEPVEVKVKPKPDRKNMSEAELFEFAEHDLRDSEKLSYKAYSYWKSTFRTFAHNKAGIIFLIILIVLLAFTFIQPHLPNQFSHSQVFFRDTGAALSNQPPDKVHWFGTNNAGQDLWARTWAGNQKFTLYSLYGSHL